MCLLLGNYTILAVNLLFKLGDFFRKLVNLSIFVVKVQDI